MEICASRLAHCAHMPNPCLLNNVVKNWKPFHFPPPQKNAISLCVVKQLFNHSAVTPSLRSLSILSSSLTLCRSASFSFLASSSSCLCKTVSSSLRPPSTILAMLALLRMPSSLFSRSRSLSLPSRPLALAALGRCC